MLRYHCGHPPLTSYHSEGAKRPKNLGGSSPAAQNDKGQDYHLPLRISCAISEVKWN
jgi:hypothetical protein